MSLHQRIGIANLPPGPCSRQPSVVSTSLLKLATCRPMACQQEYCKLNPRRRLPPVRDLSDMRCRCLLLTLLTLLLASAAGAADELPKLPLGLKPVPVPSDNPLTPEKVALGKQLYFDP